MQNWLWKEAVRELVIRGSLSTYSVMRDEYIQVLSEPEATTTFNRGIMPLPEYSHVGSTFGCLGSASTWPDSVAARMPESFGDRAAVFLPPFEDALSPEVLGRINELDANLRAAFEERWNSSGPLSPQKAFCEITKLERGILYRPHDNRARRPRPALARWQGALQDSLRQLSTGTRPHSCRFHHLWDRLRHS